jgi:hypothetical protein
MHYKAGISHEVKKQLEHLEDTLTENRITWDGHIIRMNERQNPKGFKHKSKRKMPKRETDIKMETIG